MTEITNEMLESFTAFSPIDTAIYRVVNGALETLFLSDNIPGLLGMSREEYLKITEKDALDLTLEEDRGGLAAATAACIVSGTVLDYYYRVYSNKKVFDWVHVDAHVCGTMDGDAIIIARFANISKEGGIFETILDNSDRITLVIDRRTLRPLYANDRLFSDTGIKDKNLLTVNYYEVLFGDSKLGNSSTFIHPDDDTNIHESYVFDKKSNKWNLVTSRNVTWCMHDAVIVYVKDVTAEKNAEMKLNRMNQMYSMAIEDAKQMLWEYDPKTKIVRYRMDNPYTRSVCEKIGMPSMIENVPDSIIGMVDQQYRKDFMDLFDLEKLDPAGSICEYRSTINGDTQWWKVTSRPVYDLNKELKIVYCSAMNITDEKQAKDNYRNLIEQISNVNSLGGIASYRLNLSRNKLISGTSIYSNITEELKTSTADQHFQAVAKIIDDEQIKRNVIKDYNCAELIHKYKKGIRKLSVEYPVRSKQKELMGHIRWFRADNYLIINPDTADVECITSVIEITRQKKNEKMLNFMASNGCDFIGLIDVEMEKIDILNGIWKNEISVDAAGSDLQQFIKKLSKYIKSADRNDFIKLMDLGSMIKRLETEKEVFVHYDFDQSDHEALKKQIKCKWLDENKKEILIIQDDITEAYIKEQKRMAELQNALHQAELANHTKTEFVSRISHDIRTPISAIISMTEFAKEDINDKDKLLNDIERISASNQFLLSLINDILDISKIDSGKMELYPEYYPYSEFIDSIRSIFEPMCQQKHIKLVIDSKNPKDAGVIVDRVRFNQIALNIISNAVKYTPEGGTVTYMSNSELLPDGKVKISYTIKDTGIGMSKEFQKKMFDAFTQENNSYHGSLAANGTGLGLAIVKRILDLMHGEISVDSAPGKGTAVTISMVLSVADKEQMADYQKKKHQGVSSKRSQLKGKVLLAEDNVINTEIAIRLLEKLGLEVDHVENGQLAVDRFNESRKGEYLAIMMDIQMPVLDGYQATEMIRSLKREDAASIPIIAMTADAFVESIERSRKVGMNDHITKPIDLGKLEEVLIKHTRQPKNNKNR